MLVKLSLTEAAVIYQHTLQERDSVLQIYYNDFSVVAMLVNDL